MTCKAKTEACTIEIYQKSNLFMIILNFQNVLQVNQRKNLRNYMERERFFFFYLKQSLMEQAKKIYTHV